jgi:tRNA A-37 threonylcarbamoyl transferase component Bud32
MQVKQMQHFANFSNAKTLFDGQSKKVSLLPKINKVQIRKVYSKYPEFVELDKNTARNEYINAKRAEPSKIVPPVKDYKEFPSSARYFQDYGGESVKMDTMSPKEQYKLGSQIGRGQNRLIQEGVGHTDIHEANIVKPNKNKRKAFLIDNESIEPVPDKNDKKSLRKFLSWEGNSLYYGDELGEPFMKGYNSRVNFSRTH